MKNRTMNRALVGMLLAVVMLGWFSQRKFDDDHGKISTAFLARAEMARWQSTVAASYATGPNSDQWQNLAAESLQQAEHWQRLVVVLQTHHQERQGLGSLGFPDWMLTLGMIATPWCFRFSKVSDLGFSRTDAK